MRIHGTRAALEVRILGGYAVNSWNEVRIHLSIIPHSSLNGVIMDTLSIVIIVCVCVAAVGAITAIIFAKKKGKPISSCCGDCSRCAMHCDSKKEDEE